MYFTLSENQILIIFCLLKAFNLQRLNKKLSFFFLSPNYAFNLEQSFELKLTTSLQKAVSPNFSIALNNQIIWKLAILPTNPPPFQLIILWDLAQPVLYYCLFSHQPSISFHHLILHSYEILEKLVYFRGCGNSALGMDKSRPF